MRIIKVLVVVACIALSVCCSTTRKISNIPIMEVVDNGTDIVMTVSPERNGGAPDMLELTIVNNTDQVLQFGAGYSVERLIDGEWVDHELGNFAVISILYILPAGESAKYPINLFSDRIKYPEGEYRVVKIINVGENDRRSHYAGFSVIEPR